LKFLPWKVAEWFNAAVLKLGFGQRRSGSILTKSIGYVRLRNAVGSRWFSAHDEAHNDAVVPEGSAPRTRIGRNGDRQVAAEKGPGCGQWARPDALANALTRLTQPFFHAGLAKLPGLLGVAMKPSDDQDQGDWVGAAAARRALVAALQQQSG
jgi:hypothetical protein